LGIRRRKAAMVGSARRTVHEGTVMQKKTRKTACKREKGRFYRNRMQPRGPSHTRSSLAGKGRIPGGIGWGEEVKEQ